MIPKRVLRVITRLNIGGPARQALMLTRDLEPEFHTDLITGTPDPGEGELSDPYVTVQRAPLERSIAPLRDLQAMRDLRRRLASDDFHLVHTHMAKAGALSRRAALGANQTPKLVHTYHGHVLEGYFNKPVQRVFIEIERRLARRTDALVAVSDEVKSSLLDLGIGTEEQYRVIPLGFDLSSFLAISERSGALRERLGLAPDVPLLGSVGRLVPIKDHETLLRAMLQLPDVHLAIVGDGELRAELEKSVVAKGLSDRVHFTGWWPGDVSEVMADLDLAVLSSRNEGSPVALIEAHASGLAAVATDVGGVRSVVRDGISGLLVPPQDPGALAAAIDYLLRDEARRREMGAAGRAHVSERFTQERLVSDIRSLYRELLGD